ncbi:UNVERIFIED_ORG: hypothetical protein LHK14_01100 [Roseateles sp. XES5]|nr:hypothetical protein [Roseateles sp. XES5]
MKIVSRLFRQKDYENAEYWRYGWENARLFQEVVFTTIESVVILAALDIALSKKLDLVLLSINVIAFFSLMSYLLMYFKFLINAANEKFEVINNKNVFAWIAGTLSALASFGITFALPNVVSAFVRANFMQ